VPAAQEDVVADVDGIWLVHCLESRRPHRHVYWQWSRSIFRRGLFCNSLSLLLSLLISFPLILDLATLVLRADLQGVLCICGPRCFLADVCATSLLLISLVFFITITVVPNRLRPTALLFVSIVSLI